MNNVKVTTSKLIALANAIRNKDGGDTLNLSDIKLALSDWPGTYDVNGRLLKNWGQLIADGDITINEYGQLNTPSDRSTRFAGASLFKIKKDITSIGGGAFSECRDFKEIIIPSGVQEIYASTFSNCKGLIKIIIPNNVWLIGNMAFYGCTNLTQITIPDSVSMIESAAFNFCSSLVEITIPNGVVTISNNIFEYCTSLVTIHYSGSLSGAPWRAPNATVVP